MRAIMDRRASERVSRPEFALLTEWIVGAHIVCVKE